jgi:hypothetical protein
MISREGKFIRTIGRGGKGPGEFQIPITINAKKRNQIEIYDTRLKKFCYFKKNGDFLKEIETFDSVFKGVSLENGNYLLLEKEEKINTPGVIQDILYIYDENFKRIKELDRIDGPNILEPKIEGIYHALVFTLSNNKIYVGNQDRGYEIKVFNLNGKLLKKIRKEYCRVKPYPEYKNEFIEQFKINPKIYKFIKDKIYFPKELPPFHSIFSDEKGRLFIQTYEKGKRKEEIMFDIFTPEGIFIAKKSLAKFKIGKFKNNYFYAVYEKENGFQKLVAYKIIWK